MFHRALEDINPPKALEVFKEACTIYESEDRLRFGLETFKRAISLALRVQRSVTSLCTGANINYGIDMMTRLDCLIDWK